MNDFEGVIVFQDGLRKSLARDDIVIMLDYDLQAIEAQLVEQFLDTGSGVQLTRFSVDQRQENDGEGRLQRRELIQLVQQNVGIGIPLQLDHQTDRFLQITLVADPGNAFDLVAVNQVGNLLNDTVTRLLVGNLRDQNR